MSRYNLRPLPHRNMQNQNVEENPAQAEQIVNPGPLEQNNDLLSELRIISQELSSLGTLNRITPFNGSDLSKFRIWTRDVSKQCAILGLNEDAKKRVLFSTANGPVSLFLERFLRDNETATYKQILDELRKRFSNTANTHAAQQALRHLKQSPQENVQTFYEKVLDLAEQAFVDDAINDPGNQNQLLTLFIDGLADVRIRKCVIRKRPKTLNDALAHAIDEHQLLCEIDTRTKTDTIKVTDTEKVHAYINQAQHRYPPPQRNRGLRQQAHPPPCHYCAHQNNDHQFYYPPHGNSIRFNQPNHIRPRMPHVRPPPPPRRTSQNNWQRYPHAAPPPHTNNAHQRYQPRQPHASNARQDFYNNTPHRRLN